MLLHGNCPASGKISRGGVSCCLDAGVCRRGLAGPFADVVFSRLVNPLRYSLRTLFLLVLAAAVLVTLAKSQPLFRELMLVTAIAYVGLACLAAVFQFTMDRGQVLLSALVALPAVALYFVALAGTVALVLGLLIAGITAI